MTRMLLQPGSYPWLVRHDLRMSWRGFTDMFARSRPVTALLAGLAGVIGLHLLAWPAVSSLDEAIQGPGSGRQICIVLGCVLAWTIAQGLLGATRLLFNRGDLDLLLGSPLPGIRVFAARASALAASSFGSVAVLALPVANMGALLDDAGWLTLYPLLASLALFGTACGIAVGMALFFVVGPRHARLIAQLGAALIAGAFVLGVQIVALLPKPMRQAVADGLRSSGASGGLEQYWAFTYPVAAVRGDVVSVIWLVLVSTALFALTVRLLGGLFVRASLSAAGAPTEGAGFLAGRAGTHRFAMGLGRCLRRKEWRLMLRDPNMFAQLALQMIYTVPVAVMLSRSRLEFPVALAVAPTLVVIATQIAASLAWITVSGEDAPELIAAAPVSRQEVNRGKLAAIALPIALILAVPLAVLALISPWIAVLTLLCATGGAGSAALLNLWHPMPGRRRGMLQRHQQSKVMGLVEHLLAMLWAVVAVLALIGTPVALVPVAIVVAVMASWCPRGRSREKAAKAKPVLVAPATLGAA